MASADQSSPIAEFENSGNNEVVVVENGETETKGSESKPETEVEGEASSFVKVALNPLAEEFFPSPYRGDQTMVNGNDVHMRRRNNHGHGRRNNRRVTRPQREECIKRTVYISEVDGRISEQDLASVFVGRCGRVIDCRICGDPHSPLRFGFVEFAEEQNAIDALELSGTVVGSSAINVLPSKTAIIPVNPIFLPKSPYEVAMVARTIYCTNIDKQVSPADVKGFFEAFCGQVTRQRLLGDYVHSTRIAFIEFAVPESAIAALSCSGMLLGDYIIRVSPSKTPVRPRTRSN